MSRKNIIILVSVILGAVLAGAAYWYFVRQGVLPEVTPTFPEGSVGATGNNNGGIPEPSSATTTFVPGSGASLPRLYELHKTPVAGVGFVETGKAPNLSVSARYLERGVGNIFETPLSTYTESRISNETRPRIAEAFWGNNGKSVVVRFLDAKEPDVIKSRILNLSASATTPVAGTSTTAAQSFVRTEEIFLPDNIPFVSTAGDNSDKLFYLEERSIMSGVVSSFKNLGISTVFSSPFGEWLPQFPNAKLVTLTTKPSAKVPGYLFFVNTGSKSVTKVLGDINGLTTLTNPDGALVAYAETRDNMPELYLYTLAKKDTRQLPVQTLPEKCVWSSRVKTLLYCAVPQNLYSGIYPDQWYQGLLSFSDNLWEIDTKTLATRQILAPQDLGAPSLDMINLSISSDSSFLLFMNKVSGTPWVYRLTDGLPAGQTPSLPSAGLVPSAITPEMQQIR